MSLLLEVRSGYFPFWLQIKRSGPTGLLEYPAKQAPAYAWHHAEKQARFIRILTKRLKCGGGASKI